MVQSIVQIIFIRDSKILLGFRQNTDFLDQLWGIPAGRIELGESLNYLILMWIVSIMFIRVMIGKVKLKMQSLIYAERCAGSILKNYLPIVPPQPSP